MSAYPEITLHIGGAARAGSGAQIEIHDPASGDILATARLASAADLDDALKAAEAGFSAWRAVSVFERCRILRRVGELLRARQDAIGEVMTREQGKPLAEARGEVAASAEVFDWYAEEGRRAYGRVVPSRTAGARMIVVREPIGPVAAFAPWNFPALTPARKIAGALGAGCSIIIKPSEETPATCLALVEACVEAGVPAGAINLVLGDPPTVSRHLVGSAVIRKVSFTGSTAGGRAVAALAAQGPKRATLELGGHAPVLVFDDVDVEAVAALGAQRKFRNAGQVCVAPTRFYVHEAVHDRFVTAFALAAQRIKVGNGLDQGIGMGPLANARRLEAVHGLIEDAQRHGARLICGGERIGNRGFFYAPTVLADVPEAAAIMSEEPFGPVAPIARFRDLDEVISRANGLPVGLVAYAFTGSCSRALALGERIEAGMVGINRFEIAAAETPFGGVKDSGDGREGGTEGLDAYLVTKTISQA
ncbi:NAD-dependent succinate-semialdehyde dehydrogenase [Bosea sp. 2YAB26]|uniref:NAD-dependent succinate-semialdehyde dehydrogenase n=1 Tax=Bosea sp. 2YAB26 TaxID=3237478 RepID=UPI003F8D997C